MRSIDSKSELEIQMRLKLKLETLAYTSQHPVMYHAVKLMGAGMATEDIAFEVISVLLAENKELKRIATEAVMNSPFPPIVLPAK